MNICKYKKCHINCVFSAPIKCLLLKLFYFLSAVTCEIHSVEELKEVNNSRSSEIRKCYQQFRNGLLNASSTLPATAGVKLVGSIDIGELRALAAFTRQQGGSVSQYESLFIYKVGYDGSVARSDNIEMARCIYDMTNAIRSMSLKLAGDDNLVSTQCKGTCEEALILLDRMPFTNDKKMECKAMCLHGIGTLVCKMGYHDEAIAKHDAAITLLNQCADDSSRNTILFADCHNDKGVSLIRKRRFKHAIRCFRIALESYKRASDFKSDLDKSEKIKRAKQNLKVAKEFHSKCTIL